MSNATKKIRLIQQLTQGYATTASSPSTATPSSPQTYIHKSPYYGSPLPPYPPYPQQPGLSLRHIHSIHQRSQQYAAMLKSARQALHTLQTTGTQSRSPSTAAANLNRTIAGQGRMVGGSQQCAMPTGGFLVLNPNDAHPGIMMPASPPPSQPSRSQRTGLMGGMPGNRHFSSQPTPMATPLPSTGLPAQSFLAVAPVSTPAPQPQPQPAFQPLALTDAKPPTTAQSFGFLPIFPVNAPMQQLPPCSASHQRPETHTPLRKEFVAQVPVDSRLARWQRVLSYVKSQREEASALSSGTSGHKRTSSSNTALRTIYTNLETLPATLPTSSPLTALPTIYDPNAPIPASFAAAAEQDDTHTLWSGGSAGTAGIDEFVWDEDLEPAPAPSTYHHFNGALETPAHSPFPGGSPFQTPRQGRSERGRSEDGEVFEMEEEEAVHEEGLGGLRQSQPLLGNGMWMSLAPVEMGVRA